MRLFFREVLGAACIALLAACGGSGSPQVSAAGAAPASNQSAAGAGGAIGPGSFVAADIKIENGGDPQRFFPLELGNVWGYRINALQRGASGGVAPELEYVKVRAHGNLNGVPAVAMGQMSAGSAEVRFTEYLSKSPSSITYLGDDLSDSFSRAIGAYQLASLPLGVGGSWQGPALDNVGVEDLDGDGRTESLTLIAQSSVLGIESVTVEAGTFVNAMRVRTTARKATLLTRNTYYNTYWTVTTDEWYAPGLGLVKQKILEKPDDTRIGSVVYERALAAYRINGVASESVAPYVKSTTPIGVSQALMITATFSEDMDPDSLAAAFELFDSNGQRVPGTVSYAEETGNLTARFQPSVPLANSTHTARVSRRALDRVGNPLSADYSWSFNVDRIGPKIVSITPGPGATVRQDFSIQVNFDEPVDSRLLSTVRLVPIVNPEVGGIELENTIDGNRVTFRPALGAPPLRHDSYYDFTLTTSVNDIAGNEMLPFTMRVRTVPGFLGAPQAYAVTRDYSPQLVAAEDLDGDGRLDLVKTANAFNANIGSNRVQLLRQTASGGLGAPQELILPNEVNCNSITSLAVGDLNSDGRADLVVGRGACGLHVYRQGSLGQLDAGEALSSPGLGSYFIQIADVNGDGRADIVGVDQNNGFIVMIPQRPDSTLGSASVLPVIGMTRDIDVADLNGDGLDDIVMISSDRSQSAVQIFYQDTPGTFRAPVVFALGSSATANGVAIGDVNGDGKNDLVVNHGLNDETKLAVFRQTSNGSLGTVIEQTSTAGEIEIADIDADGRLDVVVNRYGQRGIGLHRQLAGGTLDVEERCPVVSNSGGSRSLVLADVTGDGAVDVVVAGLTFLGAPSFESAYASFVLPNRSRTVATSSSALVKLAPGRFGSTTLGATPLR